LFFFKRSFFLLVLNYSTTHRLNYSFRHSEGAERPKNLLVALDSFNAMIDVFFPGFTAFDSLLSGISRLLGFRLGGILKAEPYGGTSLLPFGTQNDGCDLNNSEPNAPSVRLADKNLKQ
jgi:hypothetical protein